MEKRQPLLVVCGPTASGKTGLAVALAKALGGEVISADSMQVYRGMEIGTAAPTAEEMDGIPHHLIGILDPEASFSAARFGALAGEAVQEVAGRNRLPILCGGTGLYIDGLTRNTRFPQMGEDPAYRRELERLALEKGNEHLWEKLRQCDPELAEKLHPNNRGRVIRGLEVYRSTGVPMTQWQRRSRLEPPPYDLLMLGLLWPREALYGRIDRRVDQMLEQGLLEEAKALLAGGGRSTAAQAIGYKELAGYLAGQVPLDEAVALLKRETRRYAKRQMTWFRRDERVRWLDVEAYATWEDLVEEARRQALEKWPERGWEG